MRERKQRKFERGKIEMRETGFILESDGKSESDSDTTSFKA